MERTMAADRARKRKTVNARPRAAVPAAAWPWGPAWIRWVEIGWAAPQVIAHRMQRMWLAGAFPGDVDRAEFRRMVDEKGEAWLEAMLSTSIEIWKLWISIASSSMQAGWIAPTPAGMSEWSRASSFASAGRSAYCGAVRRWARSAPHIAFVGLGPVHRRATANARRLARFEPR